MPSILSANSSTPGLALLDTHYQQQVQQGLIPDLFSRSVPTQTNGPAPQGAFGGSFGPQSSPTPQAPAPQAPGASGGQGNAPQLALAAQLYQMLQQGPNGLQGRLQGAGGQQTFGGLTDPSIQGLFNPANQYERGMSGLAHRHQQGLGNYSPRVGNTVNPNIYQNAITALQMLLGIH